MPTLDDALALLPFQRDVLAWLRSAEADLWSWFSSTAALEGRARDVRLELLKSCYRLEQGEHADLYAAVDACRAALGVAVPVTVYQSQSAGASNAFLAYVPGEAHVVFEGPVLTMLTREELQAALAHELFHFLLWERGGGELLVADQLLSAMANHPRAEPSHVETARLFRLYLEVHADRGSVVATGEPTAAVASLVKVQTGLADASAASYLRQADEIFGADAAVRTDQLTHPEAYVRARALSLWTAGGDGVEDEIARMIEGPLDLDRLSLPGQQRLTAVTRALLHRCLQPAWARSEARLAHARLFFPDLDPDAPAPGAWPPDAPRRESVTRYLGYVLLDFVTAAPDAGDVALAAAFRHAEEMGAGDVFADIVATELERTKRAVAKVRKDAAQIVAGA